MSHEINGILFCLPKSVCKKLSPKIHRIPWVLTEYVGQNMIYHRVLSQLQIASTTLLLHQQTALAASHCFNCNSATWLPQQQQQHQVSVDRLLEAGKNSSLRTFSLFSNVDFWRQKNASGWKHAKSTLPVTWKGLYAYSDRINCGSPVAQILHGSGHMYSKL